MKASYILFLAALVSWVASSEQACGPCARHASCNPSTNRCECVPGFSGEGSLYCHGARKAHCDIFGDPAVYGFSNGKTRIKLACMAHLALFDVAEGSDPSEYGTDTEGMVTTGSLDNQDCPIGRCRFAVDGKIQISPGGQYYVGQLNVRVVVNMGKPRFYNIERLWVQLSATSGRYRRNRSIRPFGDWTDVPLGECTEVQFSNVQFSICHNSASKVWQVSTSGGKCGDTDVAYRPWNTSFENQPRRVGVIISNDGDSIANEFYAEYPFSFCHNPRGNSTIYRDFQRYRGLNSVHGASVYAMLTSAAPVLELDGACLRMWASFALCRGQRIAAVNECEDITLSWGKCAVANGYNPVDVFRKCFRGFCTGRQSYCNTAAARVTNRTVRGCPTSPRGLFSC